MAMQVMSTDQVLDHHLQAFASGDVNEILDDFTDDSVLIEPDGVLKGREAIRAAFEGLLSDLVKPGTYEFRLDTRYIEGEVAYIIWNATCRPADVVYASDTFFVRNGKIAVQTYAAKIEPK